MPLQTTYPDAMRKGFPGMPADETTWDADTRQVETVAGIGFGLAVSQGTGDKGALIGGASAAVFVGVSMRDVSQPVSSLGVADLFVRYGDMPVMIRGDIWVTTGGVVTAGADVTFNSTTGVLSTIAAGAGQFAIDGARWMTGAASGALAILRLSGKLPSA